MTRSIPRLLILGLVLLIGPPRVFAENSTILTPVSLKLHWLPQFQFAGIYAAINKGFYQKAGLNVTVTTGLSPPYDEVESGKVDFGLSGAGIIVQRLRGRPFVALGATFQSSPYVWLVRADSSIYSPRDFIGKTVTRQSFADDLMAIFYKQHVDTRKIHYVPPSPHDIDNLISGKVDALTAYISNEPFFMKERGVAYRTLSPKEYGIDFYSDILFTSENYLKQHPKIVKAFRQATYQGWQYAAEHPEEIIDLILKKYNVQHKSRAHLEFEAKKLLQLSLYPTVNFGTMTKQRWLQIAHVYHQLGMIDSYDRLAGFLYQEHTSANHSALFKWLSIVLAAITSLFVLSFLIKKRHNRILTDKIQQQTASLQTELAKREALEKLARQEGQRLQAVLDNTIEGVITINQNGIIDSYNKAAEQLFGYRPSEIVGKNVTELMPAKFHALHNIGLQRFLNTEQPKIIGNAIEVIAQHKSGAPIPIELTLSAFKWEGQYNFIGIARDISSQKAEQQALIEAKEEAEKANQAKSDFLSAMSHELRTPLNAILGFAQLFQLDDTARLTETQQQNIQYITESGEHLLQLINDVLELSKIESGRIEVSNDHVRISQVLDDCLPLLQTQASQHHIDLKQLPISHDELVVADYTRLKQVLINLVSNAIKYNKLGGEVVIKTSLLDKDTLRMEVTDTGMGIPQHKQHQLFTAFNRLGRENSNIEGTGVGLLVTKRLIETMGGEIGFHSEEGVGSTFWIDLPIYVEQNEHTNSISSESDTVDSNRDNITSEQVSNDHNHSTIFYIEDNPANVKLMKAFFDRFDHITLLSYPTAEAGLDALQTTKPSLILMDINLPGINGIEATQRIQSNQDWQHIPIIAITAAAMKHNIERAEKMFTAYITKPVDFAELVHVLSSQLKISVSL